MEARQYREQLDIEATTMMKFEYYEYQREKYQGIIFPQKKELPKFSPGPVLEAASEEARGVIMDMFTTMKRNLGYGGQNR